MVMLNQFEKYGLCFELLNHENLELLRVWRNSDFVRNQMLYQETITPEKHLEWYRDLDKSKNFYYIVSQKGRNVGVSSIKNIEAEFGEPGFFLIDESLKETSITARVYIAMAEFYFQFLNLKHLYIHVLKSNQTALKSNLFLGYKIIPENCGEDFLYLSLEKEIFESNKRIKNLNIYLNNEK